MSGLETAIRNALERSDRANAEMRARIYQSARQALETGLRKQNISDETIINDQRHRLETLIHGIEQEERSRLASAEVQSPVPPVPPVPPAPQTPEPPPAAPAPRYEEPVTPPVAPEPAAPEPSVGTPPPFAATDMPSVEAGRDRSEAADRDDDLSDLRAERDTRLGEAPPAVDEPRSPRSKAASLNVPPDAAVRHPKKRGRFFSRMFIFATLFAAVGIGAWWVYTADVLKSPAERDTSVPNPPPTVQEEDFSGSDNDLAEKGPQQGFSDAWVEVFTPGQINDAKPASGARVDLADTGDGDAVHILSTRADDTGNVSIPVPVSVLQEMAGKSSTIALTMRAGGDTPQTITVECDFGQLGRCGRHRYSISPDQMDILLQVSFDRTLAPSSPGEIVINANLTGTGKGVDLYSIRVLPGG